MAFRALTYQDAAAIESVLASRAGDSRVGVSWDKDSILNELAGSQSLGYFQVELKSFILFKNLGAVLEILLIYSKKGEPGAARTVFKALVDAYSQHEEIWLEVHEGNVSAIRFYEQQGFVRMSRRNNYYPDDKAALNYTLFLHG